MARWKLEEGSKTNNGFLKTLEASLFLEPFTGEAGERATGGDSDLPQGMRVGGLRYFFRN